MRARHRRACEARRRREALLLQQRGEEEDGWVGGLMEGKIIE